MARLDTRSFQGALLLAGSVGALVALAPTRASACSPGECRPGYLLPRNGGSIPANATTLVWKRSVIEGDGGVGTLTLTRLDGSATDVPSWTLEHQPDGIEWIELDGELHAGGRYRLEVEGDCSGLAVEFDVEAAAELPAALGQLEISPVVGGQVTVGTASGSCITGVQAMHAAASTRMSAAAAHWAALFTYETLVDGELFQPRTDILPVATPDFASTLFTECPDRYPPGEMRDDGAFHTDLPPGGHEVSVRAWLPGIADPISSSAARVTLDCAAWAAPRDADGASGDDANDGAARRDRARTASGCAARAQRPRSGSGAASLLGLASLGLMFCRRALSATRR